MRWSPAATSARRPTSSTTSSARIGKRDAAAHRAWARADADAGIHRFDEPHSLDISAQVIEICRLDPGKIDPRLRHARAGGAG